MDIAGTKVDKTRVTIGLMCNADGFSKEEPLIIAKADKPVCFKGKNGNGLSSMTLILYNLTMVFYSF